MSRNVEPVFCYILNMSLFNWFLDARPNEVILMLGSRLRQLGYTNPQVSRRRINFCARLRRQLIPYVHHDRGTRDSYVTIKAHHLWRFLNKKPEFRSLAQRYADRWFPLHANVADIARQTTPFEPPAVVEDISSDILPLADDDFELPRINFQRNSEAIETSMQLDTITSSPSILSSLIEDISSSSENDIISVNTERSYWNLTPHATAASPTFTEFTEPLQRKECMVCLEAAATHGFMHSNNTIHLGVCEACVGELRWYCRSCTKHVNTELSYECRRQNHVVDKPKCTLCNCCFDHVISYNVTTYFM
jgi:hypothetical protein